MTISALPYRPCVGIMLLNAQNKVFVGQRIDSTAEAWQMPQGGIDKGENPCNTALRELEEETGINANKVEIIGQTNEWLTYDLPEKLVPQLWGGKFRGQKQLWFAMRFLGEDSDINIATTHPEFNAYKWAELERIPELIVPFKRELYEKVVERFRHILSA